MIALILYGQTVPREVTMEEYAAIVCNLEGNTATYGSASRYFRAEMKARKGLSPPEEMREWHETKIESLELAIDAIKGYDSDEPVNAMALLGNLTLRHAMSLDERAGKSLPYDIRQELHRRGCII